MGFCRRKVKWFFREFRFFLLYIRRFILLWGYSNGLVIYVVVFKIGFFLKFENLLLINCFVSLMIVFLVVLKEVLLLVFLDRIILLKLKLVLIDCLKDFRCCFDFILKVFKVVVSVFILFWINVIVLLFFWNISDILLICWIMFKRKWRNLINR